MVTQTINIQLVGSAFDENGVTVTETLHLYDPANSLTNQIDSIPILKSITARILPFVSMQDEMVTNGSEQARCDLCVYNGGAISTPQRLLSTSLVATVVAASQMNLSAHGPSQVTYEGVPLRPDVLLVMDMDCDEASGTMGGTYPIYAEVTLELDYIKMTPSMVKEFLQQMLISDM